MVKNKPSKKCNVNPQNRIEKGILKEFCAENIERVLTTQ